MKIWLDAQLSPFIAPWLERTFEIEGVLAVQADPRLRVAKDREIFAEAAWYPSALRPSDALRWSPIDESRVLATLSSGALEVSLEFRFGAGGEVLGIYTPGRWGTFDEGYARIPWEGHFARYEEHQGVRVPMEGEVGWYIDGEWQPVWSGKIESVQFQFTRPTRDGPDG